jgi:hypothetical protein
VQRGDQWATTSRVTNNRTGNTTRVTQGSGGGEAISRNAPGAGGRTTVGRTGSGDVYAGHDGNIYRKNGDSWEKYDGGGWGNAERPTPRQGQAGDRATASGWDSATAGQVTRDSAARAEGQRRTTDAGTVRSGGSSTTRSGSGSYRPSGGGMRGGGMRGGGGRRR